MRNKQIRQNNMTYYFTLPGLGGSDENHWQSLFEKALPNVKRIEQGDWDNPACEEWIKTVDEAIDGYDLSKVVFITHSLGGITLSHWFNKYQKKIKGALIVAPPNLDTVPLELGLDSFVPVPKNQIPFPTILVASTNDPWADLDASKSLAGNWGSDFVNAGDLGHINTASGIGEWPEGLKILEQL